jgi:hypothetical protein
MVFAKTIPPIRASPGTLSIADDAPAPRISVIIYGDDTVKKRQVYDIVDLAEDMLRLLMIY